MMNKFHDSKVESRHFSSVAYKRRLYVDCWLQVAGGLARGWFWGNLTKFQNAWICEILWPQKPKIWADFSCLSWKLRDFINLIEQNTCSMRMECGVGSQWRMWTRWKMRKFSNFSLMNFKWKWKFDSGNIFYCSRNNLFFVQNFKWINGKTFVCKIRLRFAGSQHRWSNTNHAD